MGPGKLHFESWKSHRVSAEMNLTSIHEDTASIPGLAQWVKDPALLWLWCRLAAVSGVGLFQGPLAAVL